MAKEPQVTFAADQSLTDVRTYVGRIFFGIDQVAYQRVDLSRLEPGDDLLLGMSVRIRGMRGQHSYGTSSDLVGGHVAPENKEPFIYRPIAARSATALQC
jgi:hypothetical protein